MMQLKKALHLILGLLLVLIGITGLVLPILNGIIFLILGFILLSFESPYLEKKLSEISKKNRTLEKWHDKLLIFMKKLFRIVDSDK